MDKIKNCTEATPWLCYANSINPFQPSPRTLYPPPPSQTQTIPHLPPNHLPHLTSHQSGDGGGFCFKGF